MKSKLFKKVLISLLAIFVLLTSTACTQKPVEEETYDKGYRYDYTSSYSSSYNTSNWKLGSNVGKLDNTVANNARNKYTTIKGNGNDTVTILVYMCGTDLESKGGMATSDVVEMASAVNSDKVNIILYTGGCSKWNNKIFSTEYNQIYRILGNGEVECLEENMGRKAMIDPNTLTEFIKWGAKNFPANRMCLIMWDHGAGSVSGYGYDEKYATSGSMSLAGIDKALTNANVKFDFIGFDACLMATLETALMLEKHADYLIASEEVEPGIGWYYTDWLTKLAKNPAMPTIEIGKNIADSFVSTCKKSTPGQSATLSVIDLAQVAATIPNKLASFANSATNLINNSSYKTVVSARSGCREFGSSSSVDMVDLVDLAYSMGTNEGKELANALLSCVKYNNTSSTMSNSYGISIYFPYRSSKYVNNVLSTYDQIGMSSEYSTCLKTFVTYQTSGQVASGGQHTASPSTTSYDNSSYTSQGSSDLIMNLLSAFLGMDASSTSSSDPFADLLGWGLQSLLSTFLNSGRSIPEYVALNHFDVDLNWQDGKIAISEKQWSMIENIKLNVFVDDGEGYIDLGVDLVFDIDKEGNLLPIQDMTWVVASVDGETYQAVPYYHLTNTFDNDSIITTGFIPVLLNGEFANLLTIFDDEGMRVVGVSYDYEEEVDVVAKVADGLKAGDEIEFVCDYYDYEGNFVNNYVLGEKVTIVDELLLGDGYISDKYFATYQITDIYQQDYWTVAFGN